MSSIQKLWGHVRNKRSWRRLISHVYSWPQRKIIAAKLRAQKIQRSKIRYMSTPKCAAALQFFNKKQNIPMLWRGLSEARFDEMIVLDDGSIDGSSDKWRNLLVEPNHFLLASNDLFEVLTYDRAVHFSRAEIICLLQDDDEMPRNADWVKRAISLFEKYPDLLILGGFRAVEILPRSDSTPAERLTLERDGDKEFVTGLFSHKSIQFPVASLPAGMEDFFFVMSVVRAPVFIRRKEFLQIGGFDLNFAPFLCDDLDNCLRAWKAGYKVGLYDVDFQRDIGLGGMRAFNSHRMETQVRANWEKIYRKHGEAISSGEISLMVNAANRELLEQAKATGSEKSAIDSK